MNELDKKRMDCWKQYQDGAITFIEMLNWQYSTVTPEEIAVQDQIEKDREKIDFMGEVTAAFGR